MRGQHSNYFMKHLFLFLFLSTLSFLSTSQIKLNGAVVIGQFDKPEDRYSVEVNLTEMLTQAGIKTMPSLNLLKQGADPLILANDTIQKELQKGGYNTFIIVNVRGYDKTFKVSKNVVSLKEVLDMTSIYHLYRDEATSVTLEFSFFREGKLIFRDIVKLGNVSNRDAVVKKFRKKMPKLIAKWKA